MNTLHTIRLVGPWEVQPLDFDWPTTVRPPKQAANEPPRRLKLPLDWVDMFGDRQGSASFSRHFHQPSNLGGDSLWIVLEQVRLPGWLCLNDEVLGEFSAATDPAEFDITAHLKPRNLLTIKLTSRQPTGEPPAVGGPSCGLWKPVMLHIRESGAHPIRIGE